MNTRYFGSKPASARQNRGRPSTTLDESGGGRLFREHTPVERHIPRNGALVAGIAIGSASIGSWQS
jgi:hypothetical protein